MSGNAGARSDGEFDIEPLLAMAKDKSSRIADALTSYVQQRYPLATLAQLAGTEPLTLMLDWPSSKASLFVSLGTQEERQSALAALHAGGKRFVLDLPTVGELVGIGVFRSVAPLLGRPLIPQTAREELANILQFRETVPSKMSLREDGGQFIREEATEAQLESRLTFLREMLACIDELCEITAVLGPKVIAEGHRTLQRLLDAATLDAVYLAIERDAVLLSEDGGLRLLVPAVGLTDTMGVQPLLMFARERNAIPHELYVDVVMGKVARNHDFISIRTEDLLVVARRNPNQVAPSVVSALETFRKPTLELQSGVQVCGEFLAGIVTVCPPTVAAEYFRLALDVLHHGRQIHAEAVHRALADAMEHGMERIPKKRVRPLRRQIGALLTPPPPRQERTRMTPVARAAREFILRLEQGIPHG